ncbi:salicylate hydroxylase [Thozetella sp. PMI_491]|nr:salicylate hydroxylase [Thozetella sp. PMI_491]
MTATPTRIAIIGGGLAGATVANALVHLSGLEVHIYESAPEFSERGAAIGLSSNAQLALKAVIPDAEELLQRAGAVPMNSTRIVIGSGAGAGTIIMDLAGSDPGLVLHRASLLRELLAPLPREVLHANKKLITVKESGSTVELVFQDGEVEQFDAVIGADGIFSSVRRYVLQDAADKSAPSAAGFWDSRVLVPYEKARATLGDEFFEQDRQYGWLGDNAFIMHDILENRTQVQVVISAVEDDPPKDRKRPLTREILNKTLASWLDGPIAKGAIELTLDQEDPHSYSQWEHKSTPTYAHGRVCVIGDAAHATTPWQGAGAGQAFEDAVILGTLFGNLKSLQEIPAAFKAFDAVRRPRGQQVIDSSRGTGQLCCGQNAEVGLDPDKMRAAMGSRWAFIFALSLDQHKQDALDKFNAVRGG